MLDTIHKQKIFVSAYACEPNLGSEIGVGWNWVLEMSRHFDLWVLTRLSNKETIEAWIKEKPEYSHINFLYFDLPPSLRFWKKGMRGVRTYYNIWQWLTNKIVKKTMIDNDIKIFHHLTYGNALWTVSRYGQKQFFVWGPTGGAETIAAEFSKHYNHKSRLIEFIRRLAVKSLKINPGFKNRCKNANLILCKTDILRQTITKSYREKAILFTDVAVAPFEQACIKQNKETKTINYIVVGKLDAWRGFDLIIEAFTLAAKVNSNIHLNIVGDGLDRARLEQLINQRNISNHITMKGKVSMDTYYQLMSDSDVVVNTSLKEGAVTTAFDSMAMGIPLICIDTTGYTRYFSNDYALVLPMQTRVKLIDSLKEAVIKLTEPSLRLQMGENAKKAGQNFSWASRGEEIHQAITSAYNKHLND